MQTLKIESEKDEGGRNREENRTQQEGVRHHGKARVSSVYMLMDVIRPWYVVILMIL